jgi:hypothetical protein
MDIQDCKSVTFCAYLNGGNQYIFNFAQQGFDMGNLNPDIAIIRNIGYVVTGSNSSNASAVGLGNPYLIWSDLNNNFIGTFLASWNPANTGNATTVNGWAQSNPNNIVNIHGPLAPQFTIALYEPTTNDVTPFGSTPVSQNGYLCMTIDFIRTGRGIGKHLSKK